VHLPYESQRNSTVPADFFNQQTFGSRPRTVTGAARPWGGGNSITLVCNRKATSFRSA